MQAALGALRPLTCTHNSESGAQGAGAPLCDTPSTSGAHALHLLRAPLRAPLHPKPRVHAPHLGGWRACAVPSAPNPPPARRHQRHAVSGAARAGAGNPRRPQRRSPHHPHRPPPHRPPRHCSRRGRSVCVLMCVHVHMCACACVCICACERASRAQGKGGG